jgi:hypothetical protein
MAPSAPYHNSAPYAGGPQGTNQASHYNSQQQAPAGYGGGQQHGGNNAGYYNAPPPQQQQQQGYYGADAKMSLAPQGYEGERFKPKKPKFRDVSICRSHLS